MPDADATGFIGCFFEEYDGWTVIADLIAHLPIALEPVFKGTARSAEGMSAHQCALICRAYKYFAIQSPNTCTCSNDAPEPALQAPPDSCRQRCRGGCGLCGGTLVNAVYVYVAIKNMKTRCLLQWQDWTAVRACSNRRDG